MVSNFVIGFPVAGVEILALGEVLEEV